MESSDVFRGSIWFLFPTTQTQDVKLLQREMFRRICRHQHISSIQWPVVLLFYWSRHGRTEMFDWHTELSCDSSLCASTGEIVGEGPTGPNAQESNKAKSLSSLIWPTILTPALLWSRRNTSLRNRSSNLIAAHLHYT